jgi:hemolysin activation/secretion protein
MFLGCVCAFGAAAANAQVAPVDPGGTLLRDLQGGSKPRGEAPLSPPSVTLPEAQLPHKTGSTVMVNGFHIVASHFPEAVLQDLLQDLTGKDLTLGDLEEAARRITKYYRDHDLLARAYVPRQTIKDGIVEIIVLEGRLGKVDVDPASQSRLDPDIANGIVASRASTGEELHPSDLDEGVAILNEIPGVAAKATLRAGAGTGQTDALLSVTDAPMVTGNVTLDNEGAAWTGRRRAFGTAAVNDALGFGEQAAVTTMKSANSRYGRVALAAPVTYSGLTLGVNASRLDYTLAKALTPTPSDGDAWTAGATASYPLRRSLTMSSTLTLAYDHKSIVNRTVIAGDTSNKNIDVANIGLVNSLADGLFGGGTNQFAIGGAVGRVDLSADPEDKSADAGGPWTNGSYGKGLITASRTQPLAPLLEAYASLGGQFAGKNLDSSEKFSLGGPSGVRAYPVNEGLGDDGALATAELRYRLVECVRLIGFYDVGWIQQYHNPGFGGWRLGGTTNEPNAYVLEGAGAGVSWTPLDALEVKVTAAHSIGPNPGRNQYNNDVDGKHGRTQVWLSATAAF